MAFRRGTLWSATLKNRPSDAMTYAHVPARFARITDETRRHLIKTASQMDPISPDALQRRFDQGSHCYGAWIDDSLVSYGWLTCGPEWVGEFERNLQIPPGDAYIWDCATLPDYRRQGLFRSLLSFIVSELQHGEIERLWIISVLKAPAIARGISDAGFEPVASLAYLRFSRLRGTSIQPCAGVSSSQFSLARQILNYRPLYSGRWSPERPPDTHF